MNTYQLTCPLCSSPISSADRAACSACPLNPACAMLCCPNCGYTMVAPAQSQLVRGVTQISHIVRRWLAGASMQAASTPQTLADVAPNQTVRIRALNQLPPEQRDRLQAYGVQPGQIVRVRGQRPITIIQVEYLELSMEGAIARAIEVETSIALHESSFE